MEKRPLLKERLTEELRKMILDLRQNDYVKIAPERELAEKLNVSRISLRAAIKVMAEEGLLVQTQGKGTYISPKPAVRPLYMLCPNDMKANDPYYTRFLMEISAASARHAIPFAMVDPEQHAGDREGTLIVLGIPDDARLARAATLFGRVVHLQGGNALPSAVLSLSFDDRLIGRQAGEHLLRQGHRKLLHLAGPAKYPSASDRLAGFTERLSEEGVPAAILHEKMNWGGGYRAGEQVLELLSSEDPPTGIFAANDWMAAGVVQKLKEHGIKIPGDLSVIGCDDISLASDFAPALSTFRLDMKELVDALLEALKLIPTVEPSDKPHTILLPATFIQRESLGSPPNREELSYHD